MYAQVWSDDDRPGWFYLRTTFFISWNETIVFAMAFNHETKSFVI